MCWPSLHIVFWTNQFGSGSLKMMCRHFAHLPPIPSALTSRNSLWALQPCKVDESPSGWTARHGRLKRSFDKIQMAVLLHEAERGGGGLWEVRSPRLPGTKSRGQINTQHFAERQKVIRFRVGRGVKEAANGKAGFFFVGGENTEVKEQACGLWGN